VMMSSIRRSLGFFLVIFSALAAASAQSGTWPAIGPWGGDARSFAAVPGQPGHLFLGDTNNWVFESLDGGNHWERIGRVDGTEDLIVDSLVVDAADPVTLFAGVWRVDRPDGGLYVSHDRGRTWASIPAMQGQSIRSLAQAPSNPDILVVGSLDGVFRSADHGRTWARISPPKENPLSREIHEVESLAIDPRNPQVIYAGTWHLPWKTTDGGLHWRNIKQGVIDDSDVFSIIIDPEHPATVYASACSGIYKSENAGELFKKVQGIPATARRTRVLMQDPIHREVVYAGTTEGLYRTHDAGRNWESLTGPEVIVNDIALDADGNGRILVATDRGGVLASDDHGRTFHGTNQGFSARKVEALLADSKSPGHLFAGVVNDKSLGGVFETSDYGNTWNQLQSGLDGRDIFTLASAADGTVLAGTSHGIFQLDRSGPEARWGLRSSIVNHGRKVIATEVGGKRVNREQEYTLPAREMGGHVYGLDLSTDTWVAATEEGVLVSQDKGATWQGGLVLGSSQYHSVVVLDGHILAARTEGLVQSTDKGLTWSAMRIPQRIKDIHALATSPDGALWIGAGDGIYFSRDKGESWFWLDRVPARYVDHMTWDPATSRMLVTSRATNVIFAVDPVTLGYTQLVVGYRLYAAAGAGSKHVAASLQDGVLLEP